MDAFTHPFAWLLETLCQWRRRERQVASELTNETEKADLRHKLDTTFWYLPPPC